MEKLVYTLWQGAQPNADAFRDELLDVLCPRLARVESIHGIRLAVADSAVAPAAGRRMESHPPVPGACLSLWVDCAGAADAWEPLIDRQVARRSAYLVTEAEPLVSQSTHPVAAGERVPGMCQVVFLRRPASLARAQWFDVWQGSHTRVAIETQSTFGYRQNVVVRAIGTDTLPCDAIVEENFPEGAMASDHVFYATGGDDELLQRRMTAMLESCARFIDFEHIDVIPMSEYLVRPLG
ncbi:MAG: hypothetical protein V2I26_13525 [Halieaceae bacterium]|jgi:hypothetical protein|nr:hypothetical protein [Halieaceae bacterium]